MLVSRRHFFFGSLALPVLAADKNGRAERPNVVLIMASGIPTWMLGLGGNKEVRTPNIDHLAATGVRFINHYASSAEPGPAALSLLTGRTEMQLRGAAELPAGEAALGQILGGSGYQSHTAAGSGALALTDDALKFLDQQAAGKQFCLTVHYTDATAPYSGIGERYLASYSSTRFESCLPLDHTSPNANQGKDLLGNLVPGLQKAAAAITGIDDQVGRIAARLQEKKLADDTLVIFTAPVGALLGRHGLWASGDASNPPNLFEEVVNTPLIWRWPRRIPPQTSRPECVSACDLVPSVCDFPNAALPKANLSGRSYLDAALGVGFPKKTPWRSVVFSRYRNTAMVRDSRFKLIVHEGVKGQDELYDLQTDRREQTNVFANPNFSTIPPALTAELEKWKQRYSV